MQQFVAEEKNELLDYLWSFHLEKVRIGPFSLYHVFTALAPIFCFVALFFQSCLVIWLTMLLHLSGDFRMSFVVHYDLF